MTSTPPLPPPDWYSDPADPSQQRWWSGQTWTDHTRAIAPVAPPVQQWSAPVEPAYVPMGGAYGNQYAGPYGGTSQWQVPAGSPNTVPIWIIATYPAFSVVVAIVRSTLPAQTSLALTIPILLTAFLVFSGMVIWDHVELKRRGLAAASPAWGLLTLVGYLIARRIVLKQHGVIHNAPGNVFGGIILLIVAAAIGVAILIPILYHVG